MIIGKQWHYTSCKFGTTGHAGFQTRLLSPQLPDETISKLETMGSYIAPRGSEQNVASCPKAMRFHVDDSGKYYLVSSVYTGEDYSNRSGNYYAHGIVFDHYPDSIPIVDLIHQIPWVKNISKGDDKQRSNYKIPNFEFNELQEKVAGSAFSFYRATSKTNKEALLIKAITALFKQQEQPRKLVFRCVNHGEQMNWVNWLHQAFPTSHQKHLSFSTYQYSTSTEYAINFVFDNCEFQFDEPEIEYQFYFIDLENGRSSSGLENNSDYVRILNQCYKQGETSVHAFKSFVAKFNLDEINETLNAIARLFESQSQNKTQISDEALNEALELVQFKSHDKYRNELALPLKNLVTSKEVEHNHHLLTNILNFYFGLLKTGPDHNLLNQSNSIFQQLQSAYWHKSIFDKQTYSEIIRNLIALQKNKEDFTRKFFLAKEIIEEIRGNIPNILSEKIVEHYEVLIANLNSSELFESGEFLLLIDCVIKTSNNNRNILRRLVELASNEIGHAKIIVGKILNQKSNQSDNVNFCGVILEIMVNTLGLDDSWKIIFDLYDDPQQPNIKIFILNIITSSKDKLKVFDFFSDTLTRLNPENEALEEFLYRAIWKDFNDNHRKKIADRWFFAGLVFYLDGQQQVVLFRHLNRKISLDINKALPYFVNQDYRIQSNGLPEALVPNSLYLRDFLENTSTVELTHIADVNKHILTLEATPYSEFLKCFFEKQLDWKACLNVEKHTVALLISYNPRHAIIFHDLYYKKVMVNILNHGLTSSKTFLETWLLLQKKFFQNNQFNPFFNSTYRHLVKELAKKSNNDLKDLSLHIQTSTKIEKSEIKLFNVMNDEIQYKKLHPIKKITRKIHIIEDKIKDFIGKLRR